MYKSMDRDITLLNTYHTFRSELLLADLFCELETSFLIFFLALLLLQHFPFIAFNLFS